MKIKHGDIWVVDFGRDARGLEIGAKLDEETGELKSKRPALVVSADDFNVDSDRVTVVPLIHYWEGREHAVNWGVRRRLKEFDVSLSNRQHESLNKDSLIDCGQLWTVFEHEIDMTKYCGRVQGASDISMALQIVLGGGVQSSGKSAELQYAYGDVVLMDLPSSELPSQPCLVVSHTLVDLKRERIPVKKPYPRQFGQITVVPLVGIEECGDPSEEDDGIALVEIIASSDKASNNSKTIIAVAMCQEIYTLDWRERNASLVGSVRTMTDVNAALRAYLDLAPLDGQP